MPAKFTNHIREFVASSFLSSIESTRITEWEAGVSYTQGHKVSHNSNVYVASTSGISGGAAPSHVGGLQTDGVVSWVYVEPAKTEKLFEGNMYMSIGKVADWAVPATPDAITVIDSTESAAIANMVTLKSIKPGNLKACAKRINWVSGEIYDQYSDVDEMSTFPNFYVMTSNRSIYKCLDNNSEVIGAVSTSEPTGNSTLPIKTADNYVWKYMGSVSESDASLFMTDDFIPVSVKTETADPIQAAVQSTAQQNSISTFKIANKVGVWDAGTATVTVVNTGPAASVNAVAAASVVATTLTQVYVQNPGSGYDAATTYAVVKSGSPSGSGALATAEVDGTTGEITTVTVNNAGSSYTSGAIALVTGVAKDGTTITPAVLSVVLTGANAVSTINVTTAGANYASAQVYIIPGTSGAIAYPVMAPATGHGANIVRELAASTIMISTKLTNTLSDTGYYLKDAGSEFHQICLVTDVVDKATGAYGGANLYIGASHPEYGNVGSTLSKVKAGTGIVLYINNVKTVTRSEDQEESLLVALTL